MTHPPQLSAHCPSSPFNILVNCLSNYLMEVSDGVLELDPLAQSEWVLMKS